MTYPADKLEAHVATDGVYRAVSLHMAKALPNTHAFSSQRWPNDLGDGQFSRGYLSCQDAIYASKKAQDEQPGTPVLDTEKILMGEWGTGQRLHSLIYKRSVAWSAPAEQTAAEYFDNVPTDLMSEGATAAFPPFTLWAEDPDDSTFEPLLLATEAETTAATEGMLIPLSAILYGVNRRRRPLLIVAQAQGNVPDESALFLHLAFTEQHK